jgi:hypothetical protein
MPCVVDANCASVPGNCYIGHCYEPDVGNPCTEDASCALNNCHNHCCTTNDTGSPCTFNGNCASGACNNGVCM